MENLEIKKSYWTVVPAEVRYCKDLGIATARDLYGEISALCNEKGFCWASNNYFAKLYSVDVRTISRWISKLEKHGFIYIPKTNGQRKIFISKKFEFDATNLDEPIEDEQKEAETKTTPKKKTKVEKKETEKNVSTMKHSDEDIFLAELLLQKIIYNFPAFGNKKVNIKEWAEDIRKLREIDKATFEQIRFMITWLHGGEIEITGRPKRVFEPNDFWSKNILSARKLRKQWFDHLVPQLQTDLKKSIKKTSSVQL